MKNTKTKRMLAVAALLAVGLALMLYYAAHKQGYHVDELYTYELANYPGGFYALEDGYMDSWHDGSFYSAVLTPGRLFDYTIPWNNQKIDVHPAGVADQTENGDLRAFGNVNVQIHIFEPVHKVLDLGGRGAVFQYCDHCLTSPDNKITPHGNSCGVLR